MATSPVGGSLRQDFKYAARLLRLNPGFAATAILSLALGIAANTSIFTLVDQVLLRLLPVENPRELVQFRMEGGVRIAEWRRTSHVFVSPLCRNARPEYGVFRPDWSDPRPVEHGSVTTVARCWIRDG